MPSNESVSGFVLRGHKWPLMSCLSAALVVLGCGDASDDVPGPTSPLGPSVGNVVVDSGAPAMASTPSGGAGPAVAPGAGMVVSPTGTNATGTTISTAQPDAGSATQDASAPSADSAWCKVKTILDTNCKACHTTPLAAGAPFPLVTYADLIAPHPSRPGKKVYERVALRVDAAKSQAEQLGSMPPGKQLSAADVATIQAWAAAGAPSGSDANCTGSGSPGDAPQTTQKWPLPECDAVYKVVSHGSGGTTAPYMVPAGQEIHPQVGWDAPWGSEQVQAIAFKSFTDNPKVLHHWILYSKSGAFLVGWAPGEDGIKTWPADVGMEMPSGSGALRMDLHYFNLKGTSAEPDNSGVEICVVKKEHFRKNTAAVTGRLAGLPIIPANATNYDVTSKCTVSGSTPITLLTASPHAHTYARHMKFTLTKKGGQVIVMHDMPFMFGEQHSYPLDPPIVVESGDMITTTCTYTNPTNKTVTAGESTTNEMCFNFAVYYPAGKFSCN